MIQTPTPGPRKPLVEDSEPAQAQHGFPPALTRLSRWGVFRSRMKKYKDRDRPVFEPFHPATGHELPVRCPDAWVTYAEVCNPRGRKLYHGVGFLVCKDDGLAVVREATPALAELLADASVHVAQEVGGNGLVVVVRAGVPGAKTDCFVPLSGRSPYQGRDGDRREGFPDAVRTDSGQNPYQAEVVSGRGRYQGEGSYPDGARILLSSFPPEINDEGVEKKPVEDQLAELAEDILRQGMGRGPDDNWRWLYSIISLLQVNGLQPDEVTPSLLHKTAQTLQVDADDLQARVVARWGKLDPSRGLLADALRAVRADASLLKDLAIANPNALLIAGMARYMGREGKPFRLHQVSLAQVLGLPGQQAVSPLVLSLREKGWLRLVGAHKYAGPKKDRLAAEYVWTGPGAVEPQRAVEVMPTTPASAAAPPPPPQVSAGPLPAPRRAVGPRRPGFRAARDDDHRYPTLATGGGYVERAHHLAEVVLARKFERTDLPGDFWKDDKYRGEYARQVKAARDLGEEFSLKAVSKAIQTQEAKHIYSLAAPWFRSMVEAAHKKVVHEEQVLAEQRRKAAENPPPPPTMPQAPRSAFVQKKSLFNKLSKANT